MGVRAVQAVRLLSVGTRGESHTAFAECLDSGGETREYHVRFRENTQSLRTLVNDLVAHEVAGVLGVPLPGHRLVFLTRQLAWGREARESVGWPVSTGPHFGVERVSPVLAEPTHSLIPRCDNRKSFPGCVMLNEAHLLAGGLRPLPRCSVMGRHAGQPHVGAQPGECARTAAGRGEGEGLPVMV